MLLGFAWIAVAHAFVVPLLTWVVYLLVVGLGSAHAQAPEPSSPPPETAGEDEVIVFEELEDTPLVSQSASPPSSGVSERASFDGELGSLLLMDMRADGMGEDTYEARVRAGLDVEYEQSERVRFSLGGRIDYFWGGPHPGDSEVVEANVSADGRSELGIELMSAYVAVNDGRMLHVQLGQQVIATGRLDALTGLDPLGVYDARAGPSLSPASMRLPQPALRVDLDRAGPVFFQSILVPFYRGHALHVSQDFYATEVLLGERGRMALGPPEASEALSARNVAALRQSDAPAPTFTKPQAMVRLGIRLPMLDVGLSGATALEKLPVYEPSPTLEAYLLEPSTSTLDALLANPERGDPPPLRSMYPRYYLAGLDVGAGVGDTSFAAEVAFSPERMLYTVPRDQPGIPRPDLNAPPRAPTRRPEGAPVVQAGVHVDHLVGEMLVLFLEASYFRAVFQPHDAARRWLGLHATRADFAVALAGVHLRLLQGVLRLRLNATATSDASAFVQPQVEYWPVESLILTLGCAMAFGPPSEVQAVGGASNVSLGGVYRRDDHVYLGVRWLL